MRQFDASMHTPDALAGEIAELYERSPDTLLVGSLGRAVIYGSLIGNTRYEFDKRSQHPVDAGERSRDIDVIAHTDFGDLTPFDVDATFNGRWATIIQDGEDWYLVSQKQRTADLLHPAVMEPIAGETVFGIPCITVPARTHVELFGLKDAIRPKDLAARQLLAMTMNEDEQLPDELYSPFKKLQQLNNSGFVHRARQMYRMVMPYVVRRKLLPLTQPIKDRIT